MTAVKSALPFDLAEATRALSGRDEVLKELIGACRPFTINVTGQESPYEVLVRSIVYQSISGKAARTIYERIKALGENDRVPPPEVMLKMPMRKLRKVPR